ncbi:molybdenum cofactor biosynthesis protein MoaE [Infirmifilum lucidum]|uniref:Molybdenum cofactor biosynthesis protein MoaE n=1 Tax=Infirmifilum lucidum TaxID=2776706 RepID=A0A7L9FHB1_9CREN|nr:molybdenum cofactor biosynthesis protein MoaE [Infirmifilum lucidum]QOJ78316.1 molybdenum cofactor biosynthesis protein MoaE [Infirmifilum lucidum]
MQVKVKFISLFRDIVGHSDDVLEVPEAENTLSRVLSIISEKYPRLKEYISSGEFVVLVNSKVAEPNDSVREGDEVIIMPPISGGSHFAFVDRVDPIALLDGMLKALDDKAGAVAIFIGRVKGVVDGKIVNELHYETLEPLSTSTLAKIGEEESQKHMLLYTAIYHKRGPAKPGEPVLFIGVAAEGRREALEALREVLERVKHEAYVWKLERREDGEYWIIGDRKRVPRLS